jgi:yapsin 1
MRLSAFLLLGAAAAKNIIGVQNFPFNVSRGSSFETSTKGAQARVVKRQVDGTVLMVLENQQSFYSVDLKIGSNEEEVIVLVDTGSSDLWVTGSNNPYCASSSKQSKRFREIDDAELRNDLGLTKFRKLDDADFKQDLGLDKFRQLDDSALRNELGLNKFRDLNDADFKDALFQQGATPSGVLNKAATTTTSISSSIATIKCSQYGTFNSSGSDTFHSNNTEFFIVYGDSTFAYGTWGYDNVVINGIEIQNLSFAVANQTNSSVGVLGIGLEGLETTYSGSTAGTNRYKYANLPTKMVQDGLINKRVYSIYLNTPDAGNGNILFGGVDHAKYSGTLAIVPIINTLQNSGYSQAIKIEVTLSGISYNGNTALSSSTSALLDSGTTLTYLPSSVVSALARQVGATYSSQYGYYLMSCPSSSAASQNLTFSFQGIDIQAPLSNFVLSFDTSGTTCVFAVMSSTTTILGDSFLRSAYVVFDLDDFEVAMAQAVYTDKEEIEVITSTIPNASTVTDFSSTATGAGSISGNVIGGLTTSRSTATASRSTATASSTSRSGSSNQSGAQGMNLSFALMAIGIVLGTVSAL